MNETETVSVAEAQPAKPTARQYYVWQFAMWAIIVHMALVGTFLAFDIGVNSRHGAIAEWDDLTGQDPIHLKLASLVMDSPGLSFCAGLMLVPVTVITCYRASMARKALLWLIGYWVVAGIICGLIISSYAIVMTDPGYWMHTTTWDWLGPSLKFCSLYFTALPITILAALLTISTGRRRTLAKGAEIDARSTSETADRRP